VRRTIPPLKQAKPRGSHHEYQRSGGEHPGRVAAVDLAWTGAAGAGIGAASPGRDTGGLAAGRSPAARAARKEPDAVSARTGSVAGSSGASIAVSSVTGLSTGRHREPTARATLGGQETTHRQARPVRNDSQAGRTRAKRLAGSCSTACNRTPSCKPWRAPSMGGCGRSGRASNCTNLQRESTPDSAYGGRPQLRASACQAWAEDAQRLGCPGDREAECAHHVAFERGRRCGVPGPQRPSGDSLPPVLVARTACARLRTGASAHLTAARQVPGGVDDGNRRSPRGGREGSRSSGDDGLGAPLEEVGGASRTRRRVSRGLPLFHGIDRLHHRVS